MSQYAVTETNSDGQYVLQGLAGGDCKIVASAAGYVTEMQEIHNLAFDDIFENIDFSLQSGLRVWGNVVDDGTGDFLENVMISLLSDGHARGMAITDAAGEFSNRQCPPGEYTIIYLLEGYELGEYSFVLPPEGLTEPLQLMLSALAGEKSSRLGEDIRVGVKDLSYDWDVIASELVLYDDAVIFLGAGWSQAGQHLLHFVNPPGHNGGITKTKKAIYYGPSHGVSRIAKIFSCPDNRTDFDDVWHEVEEEIQSKISPSSVCSTGAQGALSGDCSAIEFKDGGSSPDSFNMLFAFGSMRSGKYEFKEPRVSQLLNNYIIVSGTVDFLFEDTYEFTEENVEETLYALPGLIVQQAGWGTRFKTSIHIQATVEYTFQCPRDPDPEDDEQEDEETTDVDTSHTPEDKFGPAGYDPPGTQEYDKMRYVSHGQTLNYSIEFWNKEDAVVPTQDAVIEDILDPSVFDLSTFEFTQFGFLKWDVPLSGGQTIDTRVDLRPDMDLAVDVTGSFDPGTGTIKWWFHCIDPMTGEWPEDPMAGFLSPYNPDTGYEIGWVEFRVKLKDDLLNGIQIANQAFVEFDFAGDIYDHPAPKDGPWINTIGATGIVCDGDFDGDGDVDGSDLAVFAADFGRTDCDSGPDCEGDFDEDGDVDGSDLATFASDFGRTDCPVPQ